MNTPAQLAKHFRDVFYGGNWTSVNLKDTLTGLDWQQVNVKVQGCNSIAALVYHIGYYVSAVLKVLQGGTLEAHDKYSYDHPPVRSQEDWIALVHKTKQEVDLFASLVEQLPDNKLDEIFEQEKYGSFYRNLQGIIEHTHYHLGQISLLKKLILSKGNAPAS